MSGQYNYLVLAMIATGCVAWEVFRQWTIWSQPEQDGWFRIQPSTLHYIQLVVAVSTVLLCLFAFSVAGLPNHPREYWGQVGLVCALCAVTTWTYAKLRAFAQQQVAWRRGELRFVAKGGAIRHYRFDEIIKVSVLMNWKIQFSDGRSLKLDPSAVGTDELIFVLKQFRDTFRPLK